MKLSPSNLEREGGREGGREGIVGEKKEAVPSSLRREGRGGRKGGERGREG